VMIVGVMMSAAAFAFRKRRDDDEK
jgi:hypothetical protein